MDEHMKEYLVEKMKGHVTELAALARRLRDEDPASRLVKIELRLVAYGRGVSVAFSVDGAPNLPRVAELERELGLVEGPEGGQEG